MSTQHRFLREALGLAYSNVERGGRPFGPVVVKDGKILATAVNEVIGTNDPTAHAELMAIRAASQILDSPNLAGEALRGAIDEDHLHAGSSGVARGSLRSLEEQSLGVARD